MSSNENIIQNYFYNLNQQSLKIGSKRKGTKLSIILNQTAMKCSGLLFKINVQIKISYQFPDPTIQIRFFSVIFSLKFKKTAQ